MFMICSHAGTEGVTDDPLLPLLDELARRHGDRAKVTVVVRTGRLPGGAAVYTDDDLREAVAAIGRKAGLRFGEADQHQERDRRREELLRQAVGLLAAVERFRRGWERELPACGATLTLLREQLREK
jgi:hypothetical protein